MMEAVLTDLGPERRIEMSEYMRNWKVKDGEQFTKIIYWQDGSSYRPIAQTLCPSASGLQIEVADNEEIARLIAAAPALLEALKQLMNDCPSGMQFSPKWEGYKRLVERAEKGE